MAARANPKNKAKAKAAKGRVPSRGTVATLPKKAKNKKRRRGDNSGDHSVPDEVYERHLAKINSTEKAMQKAKEEFDQAKGVHQSAYKAARGDGCDIDAIREARKLDQQDHGVTQIKYANVARVLNIMGSGLGSDQLDLFGGILSMGKPKVDPAKDGFKAGVEAQPVENNPFAPGSEDFVAWANAYAEGQQKNMDEFAGKH